MNDSCSAHESDPHDSTFGFPWGLGRESFVRMPSNLYKIHRPRESAMSETRERIHIEDGPKRVRTYLGGKLIADTKRLKLVCEVPYYPTYYFPRQDVRMELLTPNGHTQHSPSRGDAQKFTVEGGDRQVEDAAWHYPEQPVEAARRRASPNTGPSMPAGRRSRTWLGRTKRRYPRTLRSRGWSRSITKRPTSSSTANARRDQRPNSREPSY